MTEDKLEGTGLPAHGLVFLDVSLVLALPLYLYEIGRAHVCTPVTN